MKQIFLLLIAFLTINTAQASPASHPQRKKVGLVLSGGGAKGMAHIGALKVIEEVGIPIDYIVGTSMGSIIGGLYAIGYTPEQLDSMVRQQDWGYLLSDRISRSDKNMSEREMDERYVISVPFSKNAIKDMTGGLIKGQNISSLFSELTLGYHDSLNFNKLPIPYACVTENIVKGEEYVFHSGVLSTAMRASMAIPGVFTPVRLDSMVLVDGGVTNNYPVDVAKQMGADLIIGVDVQNELKPANELENAGAILGQLVELMGQDTYLKNLKETNVHIKVNVKGYSAASFTKVAVDSLINRGLIAAESEKEALMQLKRKIGLSETYRPQRKATYQPVEWVMTDEIHFNGLNKDETEWVMKRCHLKENDFNSMQRIKEAAQIIVANSNYPNVSYQLLKKKNGKYDLYYTLNKKTESRINIGVRFDSKEIASLLVNARTTLKSKLPAYLAGSVRLGKRYGANFYYCIEPSPLSTIGMGYQFMHYDTDYFLKNKHSFTTTLSHHIAEISYHNVWLRNFRFGIGVRYELYNFGQFLHQIGNQGFEVKNEHFFNYFASLHYETYDNAYFPSHGVKFHGNYSLNTDNFRDYKNKTPFSTVTGSIEGVIPVTRKFALIPSANARFLFGSNIPFSKMNIMGGDTMEQYLPGQLPFAGINRVELMNNSLLIGGIKLRQRMGKIHYLTLTGNYALSSKKIKNILNESSMFGCAITYGINSMFGPLEATFNYTNSSDKIGMFINLGYKF